jgi:hypothetical protein
MPQCIVQQNQSAWLSAMTACTWKRCTRHFGLICSHHQYLTQLSCLRAGFSSDLVGEYLPYCSRSVLAKAQFYHWILQVTGRTWFVDVGDAINVQRLSPASLVNGYAHIDVVGKAPSCLAHADSASSKEPFRRVIASCSFTSMTQHTGNAVRPWEYNQGLQSMTTLDSETAAYTLTHYSVAHGDYFDRACFCKTFTIGRQEEPCAAPRRLDMTRERLWMNATCGPKSLFSNWTDNLMTTESAYIAKEDWTWPSCAADIPRDVLKLAYRCTDDVCKIDSSGYCRITSAIDRSCFCHQISYESCGGSCHFFETRINYVKWMHRLCGDVDGWHGLPQDWQRLTRPTSQDMIPWQWNITPYEYTDDDRSQGGCASSERMLLDLVLLNAASLVAAFFAWRLDIRRALHDVSWQPSSLSFIIYGSSSAAVQLFGYWLVAYIIQSNPHFSHVPVHQLTFFFCSLPRPAWLKAAFFSLQNSEVVTISMAASALWSELILQIPTTYYMFTAVGYGWDHSLYWNYMEIAKQVPYASEIYAGAALWLFTSLVGLVLIILTVWRRFVTRKHVRFLDGNTKKAPSAINAFLIVLNEQVAPFNEWYLEQEDTLIHRWSCQFRKSDLALLGRAQPSYGTTYPIERETPRYHRHSARFGIICCVSLLVMWIAQWLFWIGFLELSREMYVFIDLRSIGKTDIPRFCIPQLWLVMMIWSAASLGANVMEGLDGARVGAMEYASLDSS